MADNPDVRIGTAEREQALSNLSQHLSDGRLTLSEFDERSAVVTGATTRGELDSVFSDLPTPSLAPTASRPLDISKSSEPATTTPAETSGDGGWDWRKAVMGAAPILALILFFVVPVSNSWLFFLLVPLAGAVLFGGDRSKRRNR